MTNLTKAAAAAGGIAVLTGTVMLINSTPDPAGSFCYARKTGECRPITDFPHGTCPLGYIRVASCEAGVEPTPAPPRPTAPPTPPPVPTLPVPPVSGTPVPMPTPPWEAPPSVGVASIQIIQGPRDTVLVVDGVPVRQWYTHWGGSFQSSFSWQMVPTISGGS